MSESNEERYYHFLKRITLYMRSDALKRRAEKLYGVTPEEAVEMAYDNVLDEARFAIRGRRAPRKTPQPPASAAPGGDGLAGGRIPERMAEQETKRSQASQEKG